MRIRVNTEGVKANNNQVDKRPLGLKMGYESMWSLLDNVSTDDMQNELQRFKEVLKALNTQQSDIDRKLDIIRRKSSVLEEVIGNRKWKQASDSFKLTDEHITLVKLLYFGRLETTPQLGYSYSELAKKLNWELPNEDVSNEQREALEHLIYQLPLALEAVIAVNDLKPSDSEAKSGPSKSQNQSPKEI